MGHTYWPNGWEKPKRYDFNKNWEKRNRVGSGVKR